MFIIKIKETFYAIMLFLFSLFEYESRDIIIYPKWMESGS